MFKALCQNSNGFTIITASTRDMLDMKVKMLQHNDSSYKLVTADYTDLSDISKYVTKFI